MNMSLKMKSFFSVLLLLIIFGCTDHVEKQKVQKTTVTKVKKTRKTKVKH